MAAWVGTWWYGAGVEFCRAVSGAFAFLCSLAALLAPLILENIDIIEVRKAGIETTGVDGIYA